MRAAFLVIALALAACGIKGDPKPPSETAEQPPEEG
ncbi:MAG: lipoprotein [Pseudomonadota bacterium]